MAFRTWVKLLLATLGVAALTAASQLGVAYGLGIVRLTRVLEVTTRDQWTAQLAWVAWFAMMAAVLGAVAGSWLLPRWSPNRPGTGTNVAIALAAGIGAAAVVPLTMQPARTAQVAGVHPVFVIGVCAALGAVVGMLAGVAALMHQVSRWGLTALGIAIWIVAIVSVSPSLAPDDPLPAVRLGVFDAGFLPPGVTQRTALFTMPALALVAGALLGWAARRQGRSTLAIALAGLPGPALLTVAYLIAGPGSGPDRYQVVPYWAAMTATGAGVLGSVLAAVLRRGASDDDRDEDASTADRPPLPRRTGRAESAIAQAGAPPSGPEGALGPAPETEGRPLTLSDTLPDGRAADRPGGTPNTAAHPSAAGYPHASGHPSAAGQPGGGGRAGAPMGGGLARAGQYANAGPKPYVPAPTARSLPSEAVAPHAVAPAGLSTDRSGRSDDRPGRHDAEAVQPPVPGGEAAGRKRRGWLRRKSTEPVDQTAPTRPRIPAAPSPAGQSPAGQAPAGQAPAATFPPPAWDMHADPPAAAPFGARQPAGRPFQPTPVPPRPFGGSPIRDDHTPTGRPAAPEPRTISAPLPHPQPMTPPIATPEPVLPSAAVNPRRTPRQRRKDDDYVDWVSGLGGE